MEKVIIVLFIKVDDFVEVWCEWVEMEVWNSNFDGVLRIMFCVIVVLKMGVVIKVVSFLDDSLIV